MRRRLAIFSVIGATMAALAVGSIGVLSASAQGNEDKVTICHRDNNTKQPYGPKAITVDLSAVDGVGNGDHFLEHQGPLASSEAVAENLKANKIEWGDIIPPTASHPEGLNWSTEGQAIFNNDCQFVTPVTTTTTQPGATTTTQPGATTTTQPTAPPRVVTPPAAQVPSAVVGVPRVTG